MKKKFLVTVSLTAAIILSIFASQFSAFSKECELIRKNTLRLHIIAASDTEEDQNLKLMVRDRILDEWGGIFLNSGSAEETIEIAKENIEGFLATANSVLEENGKSCKLSCEIVNMFFENRIYGDVTMPAGRYNAVRIIIGEGKGENWWCVLFPPLCISSCTEKIKDEDMLDPVRGDSKSLKAKLWVVEAFQYIKEKILG